MEPHEPRPCPQCGEMFTPKLAHSGMHLGVSQSCGARRCSSAHWRAFSPRNGKTTEPETIVHLYCICGGDFPRYPHTPYASVLAWKEMHSGYRCRPCTKEEWERRLRMNSERAPLLLNAQSYGGMRE